VTAGRHIVGCGAEIHKNDIVFQAGERISENMIAAIAAFGYDRLRVFRKPNVSIIATGSEIVDIDKMPGPDQIRNSNSPMLEALARKVSANTACLPLAGDDLEKLTTAIRSADGSDVIILTGGVSVGKYDLTKKALRELEAEIVFEKVRLKPGKPAVFALLGETLVFGLPGNPVSAAVTFYLFVREALLRMQGAADPSIRSGTAVLTRSVRGARERDTCLPASLRTGGGGRLFAEPLKFGGSSDFVGFARAEALIRLPYGSSCDEGDVVEVLFI
jgi:molybdenum cofactor synthesis domain-containing protein